MPSGPEHVEDLKDCIQFNILVMLIEDIDLVCFDRMWLV